MTEAYDEGYAAYIVGIDYYQNPYACGTDVPEKQWCDWYSGWDSAEAQFGGGNASQTT